jgi:FO synthase
VGAIRSELPDLHIHAFSALEVWQGAETLGLPLEQYLERLRSLGLGSLPGTAAEILDDEVRAVICPDKVSTEQWLAVHDAAHRVGLRSNVTIMFGHVERPEHWARHLLRAREQQQRSGGFTEFVPLPFVHMEAPMWLQGRARSGPTFGESLLLHAVARLAPAPGDHEHPGVVGEARAGRCRRRAAAGVNDLGGTLMNESISRSAGSEHGQEMPPEAMEALIRANGRTPRQRTTLYADAPAERRRASVRRTTACRAAQPTRARRRPEGATAARPPGAACPRALTWGAIGTQGLRVRDPCVCPLLRSSPHPEQGGGWEVGAARVRARIKQRTAPRAPSTPRERPAAARPASAGSGGGPS